MERLYLKSAKGPVGPVGVGLLRAWAESGRLSPGAPVSPDKAQWCAAADFPGLANAFSSASRAAALEESHLGLHTVKRIPVKAAAEPADFAAWRAGLSRPSLRARVCFYGAVGVATLAAMGVVYGGLTLLLRAAFPHFGWLGAGLSAMPLALLAGAAAGQAAGNVALGRALGLDAAARRAFALRLGWSRQPAGWPLWLGRWLFTGDWLREPRGCAELPFLRVFVAGPPPPACREELPVWNEVFRELTGRDTAEPERTRCEIAYVERLPAWAERVGPGYGLAELERAIGKPARLWASHFWNKACGAVPELGTPGRVQEEAFRFLTLRLPDGREALAVTLKPAEASLPHTDASRELDADAA